MALKDVKRTYYVYCDESDSDGTYFSNFYGGLLVDGRHREEVVQKFQKIKGDLNITSELKWQKITENYEKKYIKFIDCLFDEVKDNRIKLRIMFTHNRWKTTGLTQSHEENKYFILYYQFIKYAFGFQYRPETEPSAFLKVFLDRLPDKREKILRFRKHLGNLSQLSEWKDQGRITLRNEDVAEIDSSQHILAQSIDLVLGSMQFKLNRKHKEKPEGSKFRGKRTRAKERVYKHINKRIRDIYPNFNIGATTGINGSIQNRWNHPYRHWCFRSNNVTENKNYKSKK